MNKSSLFLLIVLCYSTYSYSQYTTVKGNIIDIHTGEELIGASVVYGKGMGISADYNGNFEIQLPNGQRTITVSYVGYKQQSKTIDASGEAMIMNFKLYPIQLNEVHIVGDVARDRETPIAFSTISLKTVNEELASQDIPMILNSTPGVYATQSGGGDGDARITIRGFNQRNVAVMIDGIPVNDMENGWVYWSNWFGLDAITSNMQVQRGLGASKIAIPSVGGTMNILTKGIGNKQGGKVKQEVGSFGKLRTSVAYNSGKLNKGWGFTVAGSYKRGNGFVDETWTEGFFYYAKVQKEIGNHILSISAMGAPQQHGQRKYQSDIATYDTSIARSLGDDRDFSDRTIINKGITYNKHWGYLDRWSLDNNGDTIHAKENFNTAKNYYHKPQFSLRDFWEINDKFYMSNILYASIGNGGGTRISKSLYDDNGQEDLQTYYDKNMSFIQPIWSDSELLSGDYLTSSVNNHYWYGALSTLNYQVNDEITISGGLDMRYYKGEHYREVYDLLGGDYAAADVTNMTFDPGEEIPKQDLTTLSHMWREGDIIAYHNDGHVKWLGGFGQVEFNNDKISTFLNFSISNSAYKRVDHFLRMDLVLEDTVISEVLGTSIYNYPEYDLDTFWYEGKSYTIESEEARPASTNWKWLSGFTLKTGVNYNIDDFNNVFFNMGHISKAPKFANVYDYSNQLFSYIENEKVNAIEGGYSYRSRLLSANLNLYHTTWANKPSRGISYQDEDENIITGNINGMNALHKGIEIDLAYKLLHNFQIEALVSLGDWRWTSADTVRFYNDNGSPVIVDDQELIAAFDATGVHVGDAAQTQYGISMRYEPTKDSYLKLRGTYFDDHYSNFDPLTLNGDNARRESWKTPAYKLVDLHGGYDFKVFNNRKLEIKFSVLNALNEIYISDAQNNAKYNYDDIQDFDAKSASVFFGLGRRFNLSSTFIF